MPRVFNHLRLRPLVLVLLVGLPSHKAYSAVLCSNVLRTEHSLAARSSQYKLDTEDVLSQMQIEGKLIYKGKHEYVPGSEFLASNEFDWLSTPFDHKHSDTLIAFGSNSAWEIAADKSVQNLYFIDWSPYPLFAQAYIIKPLIAIAHSSKEFLILLSGRIPTAELIDEELDNIFENSSRYVGLSSQEKIPETERFLKFLASKKEISDFEYQFLSSYFMGLAGINKSKSHLGPFKDLRYPSFAKLVKYYDQRYSPTVSEMNNRDHTNATTLEKSSVFSSKKNFNQLKKLYTEGHVKYAMASITDMKLYDVIKTQEVRRSKSFSLSITNIFDCTEYNNLTETDLNNYLNKITQLFSANKTNPLVVFRTINTQMPHGFLRYDLVSP